MVDQLTICTVSFKNKAHIELNRHITAQLNPSTAAQWIVVENSPADTPEIFSEHSEDCLVLDGVPYNPEHPRAASDHHARALHKALSHVKTRFLLVLDPDFYIIAPDWINRVPAYMQEQGLAVLGVPWHPRWFTKVRDFPAMHCIFIDRSQFASEALDFSPGTFKKKRKKKEHKMKPENIEQIPIRQLLTSREARQHLSYQMRLMLKRIKRVVAVNVRGRTRINKAPDTGYAFYLHAAENNVPFAFIPVVFYPHEYPLRPRWINRIIDLVAPTKYRFILPKAPYVHKGFKAAGLPDTTQHNCEEFMWQGQPFGFHVRSLPRNVKKNPFAIETLNELIGDIMAKLNLPTTSV